MSQSRDLPTTRVNRQRLFSNDGSNPKLASPGSLLTLHDMLKDRHWRFGHDIVKALIHKRLVNSVSKTTNDFHFLSVKRQMIFILCQ